jgi:hypothetical protein
VSDIVEVLAPVTPFAGAIAASPVAIGVALMILLGRRGRRHIWVFLGAWFVALASATTAILHLLPTLSIGAPDDAADPALARPIGAGVLVLAAFAVLGAWRGYRVGSRPSLVSRLVDRLDRAPGVVVAAIAVVFAINPVHLALATAGVDAIPGATPTGPGALGVGVYFAAVTSVPLLLVGGLSVARPVAADTTLRGIDTWLASHGDSVAAGVLTAVGLWTLLR